jgi:two-component system, NarL family, sensor histidine kinase BarA
LLGGEISVESELGKGSTFRVIIPWMRTDTAAAAAKLAARVDDVSRTRRLENLRGETSPEVATAGHG